MRPRPWIVSGTVALSILAVSTAAPLIRLAGATPPIAVAFWRLLDASVILVPLALLFAHRDLASLAARDWAILLGVGAILGLHFATWITSVGLTSVAASVVLVTLHPVIVGLASQRLFGEGPRRMGWVGIVIALVGGLVIAAGDAGSGTAPLVGDLLAFVGAICAALYFLAGRSYRQRLGLLAYVTPVYVGATITLAILLVLVPAPWGGGFASYGGANQGIFLALALGPMILGHTGLNWALKYVRAPVIATTILGEPVGAVLLAFVIPQIHEVPPRATLLGAAIVLTGILLVALDEGRRGVAEAAAEVASETGG